MAEFPPMDAFALPVLLVDREKKREYFRRTVFLTKNQPTVPPMIKRILDDLLVQRLKTGGKIILIYGPLQVGKTTLAKNWSSSVSHAGAELDMVGRAWRHFGGL